MTTLPTDLGQLAALLPAMRGFLVQCRHFRFLDSPEEEIYSFATPLFLKPPEHDALTLWTRRIALALEEVGAWLRGNPREAEAHLLLEGPLDREFLALDPGPAALLPIHRLDMVLPPDKPPQCLEVNCGCPGGELDPALVAQAFLAAAAVPADRAPPGRSPSTPGVEFQDPRDESLTIILGAYERFSQGRPHLPFPPTIALITSSAQARFMVPECRGIASRYGERGYRTLTGDLLDLDVSVDGVVLGGEPVHLIVRKFSTLSFRRRMTDRAVFGRAVCRRTQRVWEALAQGRACLVNPLGSTFFQDKGLLELLRGRHPELASAIPLTRVLGPGLMDEEPALLEEISRSGSFVLKRRRSFGGRHVILEPDEVRIRAPLLTAREPGRWVAQEKVPLPTAPFAAWDRGETRRGRFPFIVSPFGRSAFVRAGLGSPDLPLNAHQGGAATCALILRDPDARTVAGARD
jgi:hypothetical protein